jgi:TP901-1 family phage major tail protein
MAINGADVLLKVNTGTASSPVWTAVGGQRDASIEETTEEIDTSSKDGREKTVIAGRYASNITLDSLYVPSDTAYSELQNAMRNGDLIQIQSVSGSVVSSAYAIVTSLSESFPDQDAATVSISLTVDGNWA